jgi:hypothetical protein
LKEIVGGGFCDEATVTVVVDAAVPPGPVAVAVYVAVELGVTLTDPLAANVPTPAMLTEVALLVVQFSTAEAPETMLLGCALKAIVGFCAEVTTLTTVEDSLLPPGPVAVAVYVVVTVGVTFTEPLAENVPIPLMLTEFALLALQLRVVPAPLVTVPG